MLILMVHVVHCKEKESNYSSNLGTRDLSYSQKRFVEDYDHGTSLDRFSFSCLMEDGASSCPPWMYCDNGTCRCGEIPHTIIRCDDNWPGKVSVLDCYCLTYNEEKDTNEVGHCLFNCAREDDHNDTTMITDPIYHVLPDNVSKLNDFMCGRFNREGTLCGKCKDTFYPIVYSFDMKCIKCGNLGINGLKYILVSFVPLTLFCFIILFFKISVNSSHLHGFILFCQVISMPVMARTLLLQAKKRSKILKFFLSMFGFWNLDFFRSFDLGICLGTGTLATLALDIAVGVYPLLLMILSYIMIRLYDRNSLPLNTIWRPFRRFLGSLRTNWDIRTSVIDSYATFFLLSNMKLLSACFDLLVPIQVYQLNTSKSELRLFYDASIVFNGSRHRPYALLALLVLLFFGILPMTILMFYPFKWFQKILNLFPIRWYVLHTFVDSLQGCYKNGTEPGTRDCRWFASVFFIIRPLLMLVGALTFTMSYFAFGAMILTILTILIIMVQPFKEDKSHYSITNAIFIIVLALLYSISCGYDRATFKIPMMEPFFIFLGMGVTTTPLLYMTVIVLRKSWGQRKSVSKMIRKVCALRNRYELLE